MDLWIGTTNQGKLREFKQVLSTTPFIIHTPAEVRGFTPPKEDGKSFLDNARIKARSMKALKPGQWVMAEDSGLVVEGLNGLPGIHSARYAGDHASDSENTAKLLKMIQIRSPLKRDARFECHMVVFSPEGEELVFTGTLEGEISKSQKGSGGFGYDPVFVPKGQTQTLAEMDPGTKNQLSHRAQATKKLIEKLLETGILGA